MRTLTDWLAGLSPVFGARAELRPPPPGGHPSALGLRTGGARKRNLVNMTAEIPGSSALEAVRAARASRASFQRRMLPFLVVLVGAVAYFSARQSPHLGLHGKSLGLSVGLAGFVVGALGIRQTMLARETSVRLVAPLLALLLLSSGLLIWAQPTGPGASGCVVAISVAMVARVIPSRVGIALIVATIGAAALVITETARPQERHQGFTGFLGTILSFGGIFLYAMVVWRFRRHDEQSQRLLTQMEETRDAELRAAALAERQRLAREVHDVLAHSLSGLVVQLEGARLLALSDPADGRLAATIDRAHQLARSGLDEARRAIGMLRDDELPGPDKLTLLARSFQADTGVSCRYAEAGDPAELRPGGQARALPGHPGGADEHPQARPSRTGRGPVGVPGRGRKPDGGGFFRFRREAGVHRGHRGLWRGLRPHGHARARRAARRHAYRGADRSWLPGRASGACTTRSPGIRVLAADDQLVDLDGLAMLLGLLPGVEVVGTAANGEEAARHGLRAAPRRDPHGPAHAEGGRGGGDPQAARQPSQDQGRRADHVRRRPFGHRGPARRRARSPHQGRPGADEIHQARAGRARPGLPRSRGADAPHPS